MAIDFIKQRTADVPFRHVSTVRRHKLAACGTASIWDMFTMVGGVVCMQRGRSIFLCAQYFGNGENEGVQSGSTKNRCVRISFRGSKWDAKLRNQIDFRFDSIMSANVAGFFRPLCINSTTRRSRTHTHTQYAVVRYVRWARVCVAEKMN